ncbi:hypothetical protein [Lysobacter sp. CA199]|uniref:hypothetical protein n=1 Tax=Lysobacter sp. CA199 TaxID=3455608 RepID=UPI003F8D6989
MAGPTDSAPVASPRARPSRPWLALAVWLASGPVLAMIWLAISYRRMPPGGVFGPHMIEFLVNGMEMLILGAAMAALALVGAIVHGALTRTLPHCLIGLLLGAPAGLIALSVVHDSIQDAHARRETARIQAAQGRYAGLVDIVRNGSQRRIEQALRDLPSDFPMPRAICALGGGSDPGTDQWSPHTPDGDRHTVDTRTLLKAVSAVVYGDWPRGQKQAALYAALHAMVDRDQNLYLREWTVLWRATQADPTSRRLAFDAPVYAFAEGGCRGGDDAALVKYILGTWHDAGAGAWVDAGFGFTAEQAGPALAEIRTPAALRRLRDAGVDPRRELVQAADSAARFGHIAYALTTQLDQSDDPSQQAELIETYVGLGVDPRRAGQLGQIPCAVFERSEHWRASQAAAGKPIAPDQLKPVADPSQRQAAAERIHAALCPAGKDQEQAPAPKRCI